MRERHLRPALEKLLPVMALSALGMMPEEMEIRFPSLMPASPREEAEIRAMNAETLIKAVGAGLLSPQEARERILNIL